MSLKLEGISKEAHDEACCTYAALILHDSGKEITAENINALIAASGNEVEAYWPSLFAGLCQKVPIEELVVNSTKVGGGGGPGGAAAGGDGAAEEEKEEEKEEEEEVDMGGAGDLFGGDDDGY